MLERTYNVPLRKGFQKVPRYKKAKKAIKTLREFISQHMKASIDDIKIGKILNEEIWEYGIRRPPHHVKVTAIKNDSGLVKVELFGFKYEDSIVQPAEDSEKKEGKDDSKKSIEDVASVKSEKISK